jgi:hypothetical protein
MPGRRWPKLNDSSRASIASITVGLAPGYCSLDTWATLYSEAAFDLVGLAFDARPFDGLAIVATSDRHFVAAHGDDNIAVGRIVVTSYPHFGNMFGDHEGAPMTG